MPLVQPQHDLGPPFLSSSLAAPFLDFGVPLMLHRIPILHNVEHKEAQRLLI